MLGTLRMPLFRFGNCNCRSLWLKKRTSWDSVNANSTDRTSNWQFLSQLTYLANCWTAREFQFPKHDPSREATKRRTSVSAVQSSLSGREPTPLLTMVVSKLPPRVRLSISSASNDMRPTVTLMTPPRMTATVGPAGWKGRDSESERHMLFLLSFFHQVDLPVARTPPGPSPSVVLAQIKTSSFTESGFGKG